MAHQAVDAATWEGAARPLPSAPFPLPLSHYSCPICVQGPPSPACLLHGQVSAGGMYRVSLGLAEPPYRGDYRDPSENRLRRLKGAGRSWAVRPRVTGPSGGRGAASRQTPGLGGAVREGAPPRA